MLANRGVPHDMEYLKVYAILKYFKKLYREQKKSSPKHKKGESRVVKAGKQKLKKDRSLIKSAQQRLDDILDNRRGRQEVAQLADVKRRAALELDSNADLVKKVKLRKDI
jgi:hypothetical protein